MRAMLAPWACCAFAAILGCGSNDGAAPNGDSGSGAVPAVGGANAGGQSPGTGALSGSSGSGGIAGQAGSAGAGGAGPGSALPPRQLTMTGVGYETCAIGPRGRVACWGGRAPLTCAVWVSPSTSFERISGLGPSNGVCALTATGSITCYDGCGAVPVPLTLRSPVVDLAGGFGHTISLCGVDGQGAGYCDRGAPPAGDSFVEISVGAGFACGILTGTGGVVCWGQPDSSCSAPPPNAGQLSAPAGEFIHLTSFYHHTCGILAGGSLACWGAGKPGDDPSVLDCDGTTKLNAGQSTPPAGTFTQISAGWYHTCGVKTDGTVACWGRNDEGQATPPAGQFSQVAAGFSHSCSMPADRSVVCWGSQTAGRSDVPADFPSAY